VSRSVIPPPDPELSVPDSWALAGEAGRLGISLAGRIAGEFSRLVPGAGEADGGTAAQDPGRALRAAQVQIERTVNGVLEALGEAIDSYADLASAAVTAVTTSAAPAIETVAISAAPSRSGAVMLWIHNTTDDDMEDLVIHSTALISADGGSLSAGVHFDRGLADMVAANGSLAVKLTVTPAADAAPGRYHGMVLLGGVRDALVHVRVDVDPAEP